MRQLNYYFFKTENCGNEDNIFDTNELPKILKFHIFQENNNIPKNLFILKALVIHYEQKMLLVGIWSICVFLGHGFESFFIHCISLVGCYYTL
jgi:hypothetical protein